MIQRREHIRAVSDLLEEYPVVAIIGARQVGKTTLAGEISADWDERHHFDLEDPADRARLEDVRLALESLSGLIIIDEVQRRPDLFPVLRVLADRLESNTRFLVLGSASPDLLKQSSETLAGRIAFHTLDGFDLSELGSDSLDQLWQRGGFPRSFLATSDSSSFRWRRNFIRTFVERDLPQLGVQIPGQTLSRFWSMIAHYHAQIWNGSELARAFGVSDKTVRHYLDILTQSFVLRVLKPWHANVGKRQVRSPKVYVRDCGLLHTLLDIRGQVDLERHPKIGASWEGFLLHQVITLLNAEPEECFFWATHAGAELDFLWIRGRKRLGFEFKRTSAPSLTKSLRASIDTLDLDAAFVIHAGGNSFRLSDNVRALSAGDLLDLVADLDQ